MGDIHQQVIRAAIDKDYAASGVVSEALIESEAWDAILLMLSEIEPETADPLVAAVIVGVQEYIDKCIKINGNIYA